MFYKTLEYGFKKIVFKNYFFINVFINTSQTKPYFSFFRFSFFFNRGNGDELENQNFKCGNKYSQNKCLFWKERNMIVFDTEVLSIQRMKNSFVCNLFSWAKSCLEVGPFSLINFVDWLGSCWGLVSACLFVFCLLVTLVYSLYVRVAF